MCEIELNSTEFAALAKQVLSSGHGIRFRARGFSMRPFIHDGDLLEVQTLEHRPVERGDILLFECNQRMVVHRVVESPSQDGEGRLLTQGDARLVPDGAVPLGDVFGRVVWVEKFGRRAFTDALWWRAASRVWLGLAPLRGALFRLGSALKDSRRVE